MLSDFRLTWMEAQEYCLNNYGSNPVSIIDSVHNLKIYDVCMGGNNNRDCWIGLQAGDQRCNDNTGFFDDSSYFNACNYPSINYKNWANNYPRQGDGCCGVIRYGGNGEWMNENCNVRRKVVCPGIVVFVLCLCVFVCVCVCLCVFVRMFGCMFYLCVCEHA